MAWSACLLAVSWLLLWLLPGAAAPVAVDMCGVLGKGHSDPAYGSVGIWCLGRALHCLGPVALGKPAKLSLNIRLGKGDSQAPSL